MYLFTYFKSLAQKKTIFLLLFNIEITRGDNLPVVLLLILNYLFVNVKSASVLNYSSEF